MKFEKDGPLAAITYVCIFFFATLIVPALVFDCNNLVNCIIYGGGCLGIMIAGIHKEVHKSKRLNHYLSHILLCGFAGYTIFSVLYIGFAQLDYSCIINIARCAALFGAYMAVSYIGESIFIIRKNKQS